MTSRHHDRPVPDIALRVAALEQLLAEKGIVDPDAIDSLVDLYETEIGPHNGARVVATAWTDPDYRARLLADGTAAVADIGRAHV